VPLFLALFLLVRGTPALLLYRRDLPRHQLAPLALFSATALPLIVVITTIGVEEGRMRPVNAAALVGAGMLSVLLYPMIARALLGRARTTTATGMQIEETPQPTRAPGQRVETTPPPIPERPDTPAGNAPTDGHRTNDEYEPD
jgi:hypothetical protein